MAEVEIIHEDPAPPPTKEVVLRLTEDEAWALRDLVGGTRSNKIWLSIHDAFSRAGMTYLASGKRKGDY